MNMGRAPGEERQEEQGRDDRPDHLDPIVAEDAGRPVPGLAGVLEAEVGDGRVHAQPADHDDGGDVPEQPVVVGGELRRLRRQERHLQGCEHGHLPSPVPVGVRPPAVGGSRRPRPASPAGPAATRSRRSPAMMNGNGAAASRQAGIAELVVPLGRVVGEAQQRRPGRPAIPIFPSAPSAERLPQVLGRVVHRVPVPSVVLADRPVRGQDHRPRSGGRSPWSCGPPSPAALAASSGSASRGRVVVLPLVVGGVLEPDRVGQRLHLLVRRRARPSPGRGWRSGTTSPARPPAAGRTPPGSSAASSGRTSAASFGLMLTVTTLKSCPADSPIAVERLQLAGPGR